MTAAGFPSPTQVSSYDEVARLHALYASLQKDKAWKDFMARVQRVRSDLTSELLMGSVDKWGRSRDAEKRCALAYVNRLLMFVPTLNKQFTELHTRKLAQEEKAERKTGIHGRDSLSL